jgi:hypothetical protein
MSGECIPKRVKIGDKWYRAGKEADGSFIFKDDLDYHGSTTKIEYTAKNPNPVLHPGLFDLYDTSGSKVGEFWTEPQQSYSGCISGLEVEGGGGSTSDNSAESPSYSRSSGGGRSEFTFWTLVALFFLAFWHYIKEPFVAFSLIGETAHRKEWWGTVVRTILLSLLFLIVIMAILSDAEIAVIVALIIWLAFLMLPIIAVSIRRMHDIGKRGWWILIPLVNFVMCAFFPPKVEDNKYI